MADTKISALTAVTTPAGTDEFPVNQAGTTKKMTLAQIDAYVQEPANASVSDQTTITGNADTYLVGSNVVIPQGRLQAKSAYRLKFNATKTAAGGATTVMNLRFGTAGSTADTSLVTHTFGSQSTVADEAVFEVFAIFRTVGSGTSAVVRSVAEMRHRLTSTGFNATVDQIITGVSAGFNSTPAGSQIGISINPGLSAAWTINAVLAELVNLA